ncbi:MAG: GTPase Era [bacterium]
MEYKDFHCGYVAIAGKPNVGKSTILNNLLNFPLSIVTPKPQTTRHRILGILSESNYQIIFLDSPGILAPKYALQDLMVKTAWSAIDDADVVLLVLEPWGQDIEEMQWIIDGIKKRKKKIVLAINKIDLVEKSNLLPVIAEYNSRYGIQEIVPVSALKLDGLDRLKDVIASNLPKQPPFYSPDELTDRPQRFFVAEIIRQKVYQQFGEEIPYAVAVVVDEYNERQNGKDYIKATVVCERDSQKSILIGRGGEAIKRLGRSARQEIEAFLGKEVYLELVVDVRKNWRKDERLIRRLGQA